MDNGTDLVGIINPGRRRRRRAGGGRRRRRAASSVRRRRRRSVAAVAAPAPRRRRRRRSRRLGGRRNPGALLMNPCGGSLVATLREAAPLVAGTVGGMVGTRMLSNLAGGYVPGADNPWVRAAIRGGVTVGGYLLLKRFAGRKLSTGWLVGGGVATVEAVAQAASPSFAASVGLGDPGLLGLGVIQPAGMQGLGYIRPAGLSCGPMAAGY